MSRSKITRRREACRRKTARNNLFETGRAAALAARAIARRSGAPVEAFRCPVCDSWHIGKATKGA